MTYNIRMGIPEMAELWNRLQTSYREGTISKKDAELYKKWGSARELLRLIEVGASCFNHYCVDYDDT